AIAEPGTMSALAATRTSSPIDILLSCDSSLESSPSHERRHGRIGLRGTGMQSRPLHLRPSTVRVGAARAPDEAVFSHSLRCSSNIRPFPQYSVLRSLEA